VRSGNGVAVDSWVEVDDSGRLSYELAGGDVHFRFGGVHSVGLTLVLGRRALLELADAAGDALRQLRGEAPPPGDQPGH
jgi:hypothetical protein